MNQLNKARQVVGLPNRVFFWGAGDY